MKAMQNRSNDKADAARQAQSIQFSEEQTNHELMSEANELRCRLR